MNLNDLYYSWEDKWYGLLDKIDEKVPVYKVIEPIDKIAPSFALLLALVAIVALGAVIGFFAGTGQSSFAVQVLDQDDNPLPNAAVKVIFNDEVVFTGTTNELGETDPILLALGASLDVEISKEGYEKTTDYVTLESASLTKKFYLNEILTRELNILLKDEYSQPIREPVTLHFACKNSDVQAPSSIEVSNGQVTVIEPAGCNGLIASVESDSFDPKSSIEITSGTQTIYLSAPAEATGSVRVELKADGQIISETETVYLYKDTGELSGSGPIDSQTTANGIAIFSKPAGDYYVKTAGTGGFGSTQSAVFSIVVDSSETVILELEQNIVGEIKLKIVNERNNDEITDALVSLKKGVEDAAPARNTNSDGKVTFTVTEDVEYTALIDHEDYCLGTVKVSISDSVQTIELEPYTPACGGTMKVKVIDQTGRLVKNTTVSLHSPDGFSLGFQNQTTDINGIASFKGVKSGDYKAFAFKASSSGWSEVEHFIERAADKTIVTVVLTVPDGTIRARVLDEDGNPLQFATVAFIEVVGDKIVGGGSKPVEDINGTLDLTTRADKKIYIIASKKGYTNYTSLIYSVPPNGVQEITAVLEKEIISGDIKVEFKGIFNKQGKIVSVLAPGRRYKAMFQLRVPANTNYESIGMHVRTGDKKIMELDKLVIKELNVPGEAGIIKATSYSPENGYDVDSEHISSDKAKWANIIIRNFATGLTDVEVEIEVKETAEVEDELSIHYRAWAEQDSEFVRNPIDEVLGSVDGVSESLYANTHREVFQVGTETVCDEQFCFSANILDLSEGLAQSVSESFTGKIFREYKLNFSILNNSEFETDSYLGAEIRLVNENDSLLINDYEITGAQGTTIPGEANDNETGWIPIGDLLPNRSATGRVNFTPNQSGTAPLLIEIRSGQRIVFSKTITIGVTAANRFETVVVPELLPSGIENKITVTVKNQAGLEVADATVKVRDKFGDVLAEKTSNSKGIAILTLPALSPGEKLKLQIEKLDFELYERELGVNEEIVSIKPSRLGISLNVATDPEGEKKFTIENLSSFDVKISSLELDGRFRNLLDEERIRNWLFTFEGETIKAGAEREYSLKAFLSDAGKQVSEAKTLQGELQVGLSAYGSLWEFNVPTTVSIGLGGEVTDPTCFSITKKEWKGFTEGNPIEVEFEVQNNCAKEGNPVELKDIEVKVAWQGNSVGQFELRTEQAAIELRSGYFRKFAARLAEGETISVVLSFMPDAAIDGIANAEIIFQAGNPTDAKVQLLTDKLLAELTTANLVDCIYVDKEVLIIAPRKSDVFNIETLGNCGPQTQITLESELTLSKRTLSMTSDESKEIEVYAERNIPGQYPINIYAKGSDQTQKKLVKTVRARIFSGKCLDLTKYEFEVFDDPANATDGFDTSEVINNCYDKAVEITVEWDEHSWMDAMKTGAIVGLAMGLAGGFSAMGEGSSFFTGAAKDAAKGGGKEIKRTFGGREYIYDGEDWRDKKGVRITDKGILGGLEAGGDKPAAPAVVPKPVSPPVQQPAAPVEQPKPPVEQPQLPRTDYAAPSDEPILGPTGLATGAAQSIGSGIGQGMMGGMVGGIAKGIMGPPSFASWGIQGFLMGTLWAYSQQEDGTFTFTEILRDIEVHTAELFLPGALLTIEGEGEETETTIEEVPSEDIIVQLRDESYTEPNRENERLNVEYTRLDVINTTGVVQPDPATPIYRTLKVSGERINYVTEYEFDEETRPEEIEEESRDAYSQRFKIQLNAFNPLEAQKEPGPIPNCKLGTKVGVTGKAAVPKVLFKWDWDSINIDTCDEGNDDYIYCDATQFSIELLRKVKKLQEFIQENKPFDCPSPGSASSVKERPIISTVADVALTKIQARKVNNDANIFATVESNNNKAMAVEVTINIKNAETDALVKSCTKEIELISREIVDCLFTGVPAGSYKTEAIIVPTLCPDCENNDEDSDSISTTLIMGELGIEECEPYTTLRFKQFLEATEVAGNNAWSSADKEEMLKLLKFNAFLIRDAYTNDFRADFHEFCVHQSFFDCPAWYYEGDDSFGKYFSSGDNFIFDYAQAPHSPLQAGKYEITLDVEFNNDNWEFFSNGQPDAVVKVRMSQLSMPEPDSPFYYLPFDGRIGADSLNGRQGYGVNFRQTSEETISINSESDHLVVSTNLAASTPVFGGWVNAGFNDDFRRLNIDRRGILLDVQAGADETNIVLSPSYATPIMMKVGYGEGEDAYGFYSIEVGGSPETAFSKMIPWDGVGTNCRDFEDSPMLDAWQNTWDVHGGVTANISCARGTDIQDYGIEWCNPIRKGNTYLQSVVFTPQNTSSLMQRRSYSDEMALIAVDNIGTQIALNGVPGMQFNSYGSSSIDSVEDVFDLVSEGKVCLIGSDNRISNQFFWNPKVILEELAGERSKAEADCIGAS